jgi:hypothetical protein
MQPFLFHVWRKEIELKIYNTASTTVAMTLKLKQDMLTVIKGLKKYFISLGVTQEIKQKYMNWMYILNKWLWNTHSFHIKFTFWQKITLKLSFASSMHTYIHTYLSQSKDPEVSQMTTQCEISHNHAIHIHKYNSNYYRFIKILHKRSQGFT